MEPLSWVLFFLGGSSLKYLHFHESQIKRCQSELFDNHVRNVP